MPVHYRIDPKLKIVFATAEGILTDDDLIKFQNSIISDPDFHPSLKQLSDFRSVDSWDVTTSTIRKLAEGVARRKGLIACADPGDGE